MRLFGLARKVLLPVVAIVALVNVASVQAEFKDLPHPFMLWTKAEAAAIKQRIDTDPQAQAQYEIMPVREGKAGGNVSFLNLFKYAVMGDAKAGATEKAELLKFIGKVPEPLTDEFKTKVEAMIKEAGGDEDKIWQRGMSSFADRHMRDEQTMQVLRYDVLYDLLSAEERAGIEKSMRTYIQFHLDGHKPWHPDFKYSKAGWLPNMSWPRTIGTHVMAVALKDQKLIDAMFNAKGGWKWYFDDYISDGRFYNEEFAKYYSNIYTMLLYCEGLERLGLGQYGYGYTGTDHGSGGATMRRFLAMQMEIGYPRIDIPGGTPQYQRVMMGDAKGAGHNLQGFGGHAFVSGYLPGGSGGETYWGRWTMNGPLTKALAPLWHEIGQRRFPDDHYDYFLAAMRKPGEEVYLPSLYFGLGPIDAKKTTPPTVKSYLAYERQFALLRAEESPAYWEGPGPAVAVQFGGYYPHYAHDSFSLLGYYAFNRPLYTNAYGAPSAGHYVHPQIRNGPPTGYIGKHPWKDTNRGHNGVTVDNLGPRPVETGEQGLKNHVMRSSFTPAVKFVAGRTQNVFPSVQQERAVFLTKEYMLDVFWLADTADKTRRYEWAVMGMGALQLDDTFKPSSELNGSMLYRPLPWQGAVEEVTEEEKANIAQPAGYEDKTDANDLTQVSKLTADNTPWTAGILQTCALADVATSKLGKAFYDRKVGVRVSMLPEKATAIYAGNPPQPTADSGGGAATIRAGSEVGGAYIMVRREAPSTTFVALHEPYENSQPRPLTIARLAQASNAFAVVHMAPDPAGGPAPYVKTPKFEVVAVAVKGPGVDDRVALVYGGEAGLTTVVLGEGESMTFASQAYIRITPATVTVDGSVTALTLKVAGTPKLILNGKEASASVASGLLVFKTP